MKPMRLHASLFIIIVLNTVAAAAQPDSVQVTRNFQFEDGVYFGFDDFRANRPSLGWDEVDAQLATSHHTYTAQVEYIRKKGGALLPLDSIWGLCLDGTPFIRLPDTVEGPQARAFAGLRVRGRICYYTYEVPETKWIEIAAYNPLTGRPFRRGAVPQKTSAVRERILHFEDGSQRPFEREAFLSWIEDDPQLWRTVAGLSDEEIQDKLFKCLLIYDDRNPAYVPAR